MNETLGIPEMRLTIARFLALKDLLSCTLASKDWNITCQPLIWRKILLGIDVDNTRLPSPTAMEKYGSHIRELLLENFQGMGSFLLHCNYLTVIKLLAYDNEESSEEDCGEEGIKYSDDLAQLLTRNQATLRVFENHWSNPEIPKKALHIILSCPKLEELFTTGVTYDSETWEMFIKVCTRLKRFVSVDDTISPEPVPPERSIQHSIEWSNVTTLSFQYPNVTDEPEFVMECIKRCPQLRSLIWDTQVPFPTKEFVKKVLPTCPKLDSVSIQDVFLKDDDVSQVLDGMNQLRFLKIRGLYDSDGFCTLGELSFGSLRRHFSTLTTVCFRSAYHIKSQHVQEILASCPSLEIIEAREIWAHDIRDGAPWVCTGLRSFRICIMGAAESFEEGASKAVFGQLSRLQQLYELDISKELGTLVDGLSLSLEAGLQDLAGLKKLQYFSAMRVVLTMTAEDVDWVGQNWKNLIVWEGTLHPDVKENALRTKQLRGYGVQLGTYDRSEVPGSHHHVYPLWHKTAQRYLSVIAAILCIAFPVAYGEGSISSETLGAVLGIYFGLWLVFSLIVRFLVPSPNFEPSLPVYTHSSPVPNTLHSPTHADAQPLSSAIRIHPSTASKEGSTDKSASKGARFADPEDSPHTQEHPRHRIVTFQTRPRAGTTDSTNSTVFPTFAAYRQAQNNSIDAFAQRVKKAFAISQQQQEQARIAEVLRRQKKEEEEEEQRELQEQQQLQQQQQDIPMQPTNTRHRSSSNVFPLSSSSVPRPGGNRLRSSSAASMFSDIAERIKNGSLFKRSSSYGNTTAATEEEGIDNEQLRQDPTMEPGLGGLSGIEIMVTSSEDNHPLSDTTGHVKIDTDAHADTDEAQKNKVLSIPATAPGTTAANSASRPGYHRTNTNPREPSPLASASNMVTMSRND
ncbi:hypothetical protein BGX27_000807 [Mortierella sp. AM989]|nr:hypothetical protein BGX27_000807 [Mortierella sp. AM989]